MKIAIISNCRFLDNGKQGWIKNNNDEIFILQNCYFLESRSFKKLLLEKTSEFEKIVVFVDKPPSDILIEFSKLKIPPEKIILCSCRHYENERSRFLTSIEYSSVKRILTADCSGYNLMNYIYHHFLEKGELPK